MTGRQTLVFQLALISAFVFLLIMALVNAEKLTTAVAVASMYSAGLGTIAGLLTGHGIGAASAATNVAPTVQNEAQSVPKEAVQ